MQVPVQVIELILNHSSKTLSGVAGIYNRYNYLDEKREALQNFADRIDSTTFADANEYPAACIDKIISTEKV